MKSIILIKPTNEMVTEKLIWDFTVTDTSKMTIHNKRILMIDKEMENGANFVTELFWEQDGIFQMISDENAWSEVKMIIIETTKDTSEIDSNKIIFNAKLPEYRTNIDAKGRPLAIKLSRIDEMKQVYIRETESMNNLPEEQTITFEEFAIPENDLGQNVSGNENLGEAMIQPILENETNMNMVNTSIVPEMQETISNEMVSPVMNQTIKEVPVASVSMMEAVIPEIEIKNNDFEQTNMNDSTPAFDLPLFEPMNEQEVANLNNGSSEANAIDFNIPGFSENIEIPVSTEPVDTNVSNIVGEMYSSNQNSFSDKTHKEYFVELLKEIEAENNRHRDEMNAILTKFIERM